MAKDVLRYYRPGDNFINTIIICSVYTGFDSFEEFEKPENVDFE